MDSDGPLDALLRERFGIDAFHPWQREAIDALLGDPGRVLVVAPTGGGKSLTYQLPAAALPGTALVISPLVALMEDQVQALERRGIPATWLSSTVDPDARRTRMRDVRAGRYKLVYAAPERLGYDGFAELFAQIPLSLVAVDEAHCISMWGHDFRPDYLRIGALLDRLKPARVLACTATATPDVRREILERMGLDAGGVKVVLRGFARPNLHLAARAVEGPTESRSLVRHELARVLGDPAKPRGGGIVYAATRKTSEALADDLRARGWNVAPYHAGLDAEVRSNVSARFARRSLDLVVATNAFGMGIDRPDIRVVVHHQPPASIESYYQEVGRAGRDGAEAHGLLLCAGNDIALRRRLCQLGGDGEAADPAQAARAWGLFRDLLRYLDAGTCRHDFMLRYFGDDQETLGGCGHCDICVSLDEGAADDANREEASTVARMAMAAVARAHERAGVQAIAEMLRGVVNARTERFGFTKVSTFGLLKDKPQEWVVALLRATIAAGWVDLTPTDHPVPVLTRSGWDAMRSKDPLRFRLPRGAKPKGARGAGAARPVIAYDAALFEKLRSHRNEVARRRGFPAYVVAFDRSLQEMAARRPRSAAELAAITGFGPARVEAYGEGFLAVLRG
ncbi:MAG: ATP-dependent DNA helicase RecQ [Polyangiales bacterium]